MNRVQLSETPVRCVERLLILRGELCVVAERGSRWRTWANVDHRWNTVRVVDRPLTATTPPSKFGSTHNVHDASRPVPRCVQIPLHVRVVGKQFTVRVVAAVEFVAEPTGHEFPVLAIRIDLTNVTTRCADASHEAARWSRNQSIFVPSLRNAGGIDLCQVGAVSADNDQRLSIGVRQNRVRSMFAGTIERS